MELSSIRRHARAGTRWTTLATVYMTLVDTAALMVLARLVERSAFGLLAIVMVAIGFGAIFLDFGMSAAVIHRERVSRDEYSTLFWLNVFSGLVLYLIMAGLAPVAARCYQQPELGRILPLLACNLPAASLGLLHRTVMQKELRFRDIALIEMAGKTVYLAVAVLLAWRGMGVYALVFGSMALFLLTNLLFLAAGNRRLKLRAHFCWREAVPFWRIGGFQTGTGVVNYLVSNLDVLLIGVFFPIADLGGYNLAKQLAMRPFLVISQVFSRLVGPLLAKLQARREDLRHAYFDFLSILSFMAAPVFVLAAVWGGDLMRIFYGPAYDAYAPLFRVMCVGMIFISYGNPVGGLIVATGRTGLGLVWEVTASVLRIAAVAAGCLISLNGVVWAQLATAALLFFLGYRVLVFNLCGMTWRRFVTPLARAAVVAAAAAAVSLAAARLPGGVWVRAGVGLALGLALYRWGFVMIFRAYYDEYIRHWLTRSAAEEDR